MGQIKYYLDEHVSNAVADGLRRRGIDVVTLSQLDMLGATDQSHIEKAGSVQRVIFTQDPDFLRLHAEGLDHWGIVFAIQGAAIGDIIRGLLLIYQVLTPEDMRRHVEFI